MNIKPSLAAVLTLTVAQFAQRALYVDNQPYSLVDYPYVPEMLNTFNPRTVFKTARQVTKTTMLTVRAVSRSVRIDGYKTMFVLPSQRQASDYSAKRLSSIINRSPYFKGQRMPLSSRWMTELPDGQQFTVVYAKDDADRARGQSADEITYDEAQDIVLDVVQPIISEALSNSRYDTYETFSGTPKSIENPLEVYWASSDQREWMMKCSGCNTYNYITSTKSIGKKGPICVKCGKGLQVRDGFWYPLNKKSEAQLGGTLQAVGFHVPQPIMPRKVENPTEWAKLLTKMAEYSDAQFANEVLGVSAKIGERWVTHEMVRACCRNYDISCPLRPENLQDIVRGADGRLRIYAGIDWGGEGSGVKSGASHTALWIWGQLPNGLLKALYFQLWPPGNAHQSLTEVIDTLRLIQPLVVGADAGMGQHANPIVMRALGRNVRYIAFQYNSSKNLVMDGKDRILIDRTRAVDDFMLAIKNTRLRLPRETYIDKPSRHFLAVHEHMTTPAAGVGRRIWIKSPDVQDDYLHAAIFGKVAGMMESGNFGFYNLQGIGQFDLAPLQLPTE